MLAASKPTRFRSALGLTTTRSGSQLHFPGRTALSPAGFAEIAANGPVFTPAQIGSEWFTGLLPQAATTGLVTYSNRLDDASWTKTNCTAEWVADAGLAFGGYTLVTATGANATVTRELTRSSANRRSLMLADVPAGNVGTVSLSQDNGVVQVTMADGFGETETAQATAANPTLHMELSNSGDTVRVYNWNHTEPADGVPVYRWLRPVAATPETVGSTIIRHVFSSGNAPDDFDVTTLFKVSDITSTAVIFDIYNSSIQRSFELYTNTGKIRAYALNEAAESWINDAETGTRTIGETVLIRVAATKTTLALHINGALDTVFSAVSGLRITAGIDRFDVGGRAGGFMLHSPIIALRDNNGQIFGSANSGFNLSAITAFEATL